MKDVMVDLETMGCGYRAAIVAIGAVRFDPVLNVISDNFYRTIALSSCQAAGQTIDASTVLWWMAQEPAARGEVVNGEFDLDVALAEFAGFLAKNAHVWGNGSNFDNRILREAYELVGQPCPWHYRGDRDMRTIVALAKSLGITANIIVSGTKHHALDDAVYQAKVVNAIYAQIRVI